MIAVTDSKLIVSSQERKVSEEGIRQKKYFFLLKMVAMWM